jgi:hypothetical protein
MDPNSSNQDNSNTAANPPQTDTTQTAENQTQAIPQTAPDTATDNNQVNQTQIPPSTPPESDVNTTLPSDPNNNIVQPADQTGQNTAPVENAYINDVGEDLIDLLDEISENDTLLQAVAGEMKLDANKVKSMLASVLDKIDNEQITTEDIALIMAATVADEVPING